MAEIRGANLKSNETAFLDRLEVLIKTDFVSASAL